MSLFSWGSFRVFAAALGLAAVACGGGSRTERTPCNTNLDCGSGFVCFDGLCTSDPSSASGTPCRTSLDCPSGETCAGGICGGDAPRTGCTNSADCPGRLCNVGTQTCVDCLNDNQCPRGLICLGNGTCGGGVGGGNAQCVTNFDCPGAVCVFGRCLPCNVNNDCTNPGEICLNNKCEPESGAPECASQSDCESYGMLCDTLNNRCEPCDNFTNTCETGKDCVEGRCLSEGAGGTGDGSVGSRCRVPSDCRNNFACWPARCTPCFFDSMCNGGLQRRRYCDVESGRCLDGECESASECQEGEGCSTFGQCGQCASSSNCRPGETCEGGVCRSGPVTLGSVCVQSNQCQDGQMCFMNEQGVSRCTRACVGNGRGGDDDCPSGFACLDYDSGGVDGARVCVSSSHVSQSTPGQPFTSAPGAACSTANNSCQTSVCLPGGACARSCMSNGDCNGGEVCRADGSGNHYCVTSTLSGAGTSCSSNSQCDSGVCTGRCSGTNTPCDSSSDCGGTSCQGTCANQCRSNDDCVSGQTCLPWAVQRGGIDRDWILTCQSGTSPGNQPNGSSCSVNSDCDSWWCIDEICTEPCGSNLDCTGGLASRDCGPVRFEDAQAQPVYSLAFCVY